MSAPSDLGASSYLRTLLRSNRRPVFLAVTSTLLLVAYLILVRMMAHGHIAHVLLGGGASAGATAIAVSLVVVRFITVILVPGLMLAAFAELLAYVLVGPRRDTDDDDEVLTEPD